MQLDDDHRQILQWLDERGHSPEEIEKIFEKLKQYDARIVRESLFDELSSGDFDVELIIKEALG